MNTSTKLEFKQAADFPGLFILLKGAVIGCVLLKGVQFTEGFWTFGPELYTGLAKQWNVSVDEADAIVEAQSSQALMAMDIVGPDAGALPTAWHQALKALVTLGAGGIK